MSAYYIVIDLEMNPVAAIHTDLKTSLYCETIEIGAVKIEAGSNRTVSEFSRVICPEYNSRIEPHITRLTGITTREVRCADSFRDVFAEFTAWVGSEPVQFYGWSNSDYLQLTRECHAKGIPFPETFGNWVDFQAEYPRYLGYDDGRCLSLKNAARMIGATVVSRQAHRALYDARITSQLVVFALSGAYRHYTSALNRTRSSMTYSISDACGGKLSALLARMNERNDPYHADRYSSPAPEFVR